MAVLQTALTEADARLHNIIQVPGGRRIIIRKWQFIDATAADTLIAAAPATVTSPQVDGQTYTGTYYVHTERGEGEQDRSVTVYQYMTLDDGSIRYASERTTLFDENTYVYKDWPTLVHAPPDTQGVVYAADNSMNDDGTYESKMRAVTSAEANAAFQSRSTAFRVEDTTVYKNQKALISAPTVTGSGMYEVTADINRDGTYDERLVHLRGTDTAYIEFVSKQATLSDETDTIYKDATEPVAAPADSQGVIFTADNQITDIGTYNSVIKKRESTPVTASFQFKSTAFRKGQAWIYDNQPSPVAAPAITGAGIYESKNEFRDDGTYGGILMLEDGTAAPYIEFISEQTYKSTDTTQLYKDSNTFLEAPDNTQGNVFSANNSITEIGTYNGSIVQRESIETAFVSEGLHSPLGTTQITHFDSDKTLQTPNATTRGHVYSMNQRMNADQTYTGELQDIDSTEFGVYTSWTTKYGIAFVYHYRNADSDEPVDYKTIFDAAGGTNSVATSVNQDGTYDMTIAHTPSDTNSGIFVFEDVQWTTHDIQHRNKPGSNDTSQWREIQMQIYQAYKTTKDNAADYNSAGAALTGVGGRHGVSYEPKRSHGQWIGMYHLVTDVGSWQDDV